MMHVTCAARQCAALTKVPSSCTPVGGPPTAAAAAARQTDLVYAMTNTNLDNVDNVDSEEPHVAVCDVYTQHALNHWTCSHVCVHQSHFE